ncbi:MAG: tRNA (N6-isopentenyl adenosine(37)-C2)-methylthiotransferase MiaB, partial [Acidaminococcaceae bacterium]
MDNKTYTILNYGCQMNESDSEHFAGQLSDLGYSFTNNYHEADVVVVNTCCVRESAEKKILGKIGELKSVKAGRPGQIICVAGCMAQKGGDKLVKKYPQIDLLIGTAQVNNFKAILLDFLVNKGQKVYDNVCIKETEFEGSTVRKSNFAAWVPIMYGCNNFCTYCIVPYVRGRERSRSKESIKKEIESAVADGFKEFTLLGQNVNSYGKDQGNAHSFADLLKECNDIPGVERIRYMTSHPRDMNEEVVKVVSECRNICENFHIPAQSGSNRILKAMNRGYTRDKYLALVASIRKYCPEAAITTDIIVGFPGETEEDFQDTLSLMREVQFDAAYTFIYSKRSGTPAAAYDEQIPLEIKKERLNRLMEVQNENSLEKNKLLIGQKLEVLAEGPSQSNKEIWSGRTRTNKLVLWPVMEKEYKVGQSVVVEII